MSRTKLVLLAALALCVAPSIAMAVPTIVVGTHVISPTSNQQVTLFVSGGDLVWSVDLYSVIGNNLAGPNITAIDITGPGLMLEGGFAGPLYNPNSRQAGRGAYAVGLDGVGARDVPASGPLAIVTFDATGVAPGTYSWSLTGNPILPTLFSAGPDFEDTFPNITSGFVVVVPEPSSIVLGSLAAAALVAVAFRRNYPCWHGQETTMRRLLKDG